MAKIGEAESLPVNEARNGDEQAWDTLFRRFQLPIYAYLVELLHDEQLAKDLVQETFSNAVRYIQRLRQDERFGSWLFAIAHQKCLQHWRRDQHDWEPLDEQKDQDLWEDSQELPDSLLLRQEREEEFMSALTKLSGPHREVLLLHYLEEFSLQEIAQITGAGVGTVKSRMHYAKQALRQLLKEPDENP